MVEKQLAEERRRRIEREYTDEIRTYKFSGATVEETVRLLMFADGVIQKDASFNPSEVIRKILKAFTEVSKRLEEELGDSTLPSGGNGGEIEQEAQKIAKARNISIADAYAVLFRERPDLYEQYRRTLLSR